VEVGISQEKQSCFLAALQKSRDWQVDMITATWQSHQAMNLFPLLAVEEETCLSYIVPEIKTDQR